MIKFSEWEQKNFRNSLSQPHLTVLFPSREIYFSNELLNILKLENSSAPKTLDQYYELCHPSDHAKIKKFEDFLYASHENFFSLTRKLYCGDGVYRNFRLDAFIQRDNDNKPAKLFGNEISSLNAWLTQASEGDKIELDDRILEATSIAGTMILKDVSIIRDLERENLILRHEISRRIFSPFPTPIKIHDDEKKINVAVMGLSGSGKSSLISALTGEKITIKNVPISFYEGEKKEAKIFYNDGHVIDLEFKSEDLGNVDKVAKVEISIPGALIPEGVCLIDTPGLDSLNNSQNLKNMLAALNLDLIIYILPIRSRLKGSDYKFLRDFGDKKIIFALSKIDLEISDTEAGQIIKTPIEKILSDIDAIKNEIKNFNGSDAEFIPVSAKIAAENFFSRNSDAWKNSNIDSLIKRLNLKNDKPSDISKINFDFSHAKSEKHLLSSLITSMREHGFKGRFFSQETFSGGRKAILLGAERNMSLKLFARLSHNLRFENSSFKKENEWLFAGNSMPAGFPFECKKIETQALARDENILIAPPDYLLKEDSRTDSKIKKLLNEFTPVVSVDLARLESGFSDLIFSPYAAILARTKWILTFPNAALLSSMQEESGISIADLKTGIKNFCENNGLKSPEIFIFENYTIF